MMRHCDGNDPNLLKCVDPDTGEHAPAGLRLVDYVPCDCGLRFDDVTRLTIWPHRETSGMRAFKPQPARAPRVRRMIDPPLSPEETTTEEAFALASFIGVRLTRMGYMISEMEAISVAEEIIENWKGRKS